jgi:hypothetical protein
MSFPSPRIPAGLDGDCWQMRNPDPNAAWDFWIIKSIIQNPMDRQTMTAETVVPARDGDLVFIKTSVNYQEITKLNVVKVLKGSYSSVGPISISKLKVKEYFARDMRELFRIDNEILRFSREGRFLDRQTRKAPDVPLILDAAPPKSFDVRAAAKEGQLPSREQLALWHSQMDRFVAERAYRVYFPKYTPVLNKAGLVVDFDVDGGQVVPGPRLFSAAVDGAGERPGPYKEIAFQDGDPPMVDTVVYFITAKGEFQPLFTEMCTGVTGAHFYEKVIVKKQSSWLGKSRKITSILKDLSLEGMMCSLEHTPITGS